MKRHPDSFVVASVRVVLSPLGGGLWCAADTAGREAVGRGQNAALAALFDRRDTLRTATACAAAVEVLEEGIRHPERLEVGATAVVGYLEGMGEPRIGRAVRRLEDASRVGLPALLDAAVYAVDMVRAVGREAEAMREQDALAA